MKSSKTIIFVAGARPNFMKIAPILRQVKVLEGKSSNRSFDLVVKLVHTGQHYDQNMSEIFFSELEIPEPDWNLAVGSGTHAQQTAKVMVAFETLLNSEKPDLIVVVGDVNSTVACSLTAKKLNIPVAHVEAGLRSFDTSMPEEINRKLTDAISDILFVTEQSGIDNLVNEGVSEDRIKFVGNVMIDNLLFNLDKLDNGKFNPGSSILEFQKKNSRYMILTLHRPSNVDDPNKLAQIWAALQVISKNTPILFPVHPRTLYRINSLSLSHGNIKMIEPLGYLDMLFAVKNSSLVLTDSGGLQEETTALGIPCITIRENTERPSTIEIGTNYLTGTDPNAIIKTANKILADNGKNGEIPHCGTDEHQKGLWMSSLTS